MTAAFHQADPKHGQRLPTGYQLAQIIHRFRKALYRHSIAAVKRGQRLNLTKYVPKFVELTQPHVGKLVLAGGHQAIARIESLLARKHPQRRSIVPVSYSRGMVFVRKRIDIAGALEIRFDLFNPRITEYIRRLTFDFCQETLNTLSVDVWEAYEDLRGQLREALERGEAQKELVTRVQEIFDDPDRAFRIATTEASRAVHGGQLLAAQESEVVKGKRWLASSDACDFCLGLDGKEVGLEEDFAVRGTGPYARIPHPPGHPHCMCAMEEVIG